MEIIAVTVEEVKPRGAKFTWLDSHMKYWWKGQGWTCRYYLKCSKRTLRRVSDVYKK